MKTYVTFGYAHIHKIDDMVFGKDCVAVIEAEDMQAGRKKAFELFGPKFCTTYCEESFNINGILHHFPRGLVSVESETI